MKKVSILLFNLVFLSMSFTTLVLADCFDGKGTAICSINNISECNYMGECSLVNGAEVNAPPFLKIDFNKNSVSPAGQKSSVKDRRSKIGHKVIIDDKLFLQGAEDGIGSIKDGAGWTIAISKTSGRMVLTVAVDETAFVAMGNCICDK